MRKLWNPGKNSAAGRGKWNSQGGTCTVGLGNQVVQKRKMEGISGRDVINLLFIIT